MEVGRRIYYETSTGNVIVDTGERRGPTVLSSNVDLDIEIYKALSERNRETFDYIELKYGQYTQDFMEQNGYRVNPETKELEFSYPDPNEPEVEQPYHAPLSVKVAELKQENMLLKAQSQANAEMLDFQEEVIAEIILTIMP